MPTDPNTPSIALLAGTPPTPETPSRFGEPEPVQLRAATMDDAAALALVGGATFLEAFTWMLPGADIVEHCARHHTPDAYRRYLAAAQTHITLAETVAGRSPVGYALLTVPELPSFDVQPGDLELKRIYRLGRFHRAPLAGSGAPEATGSVAVGGKARPPGQTSLGQALLDHTVAEARRRGAGRLLLGTHVTNRPAIAFYRRNGFDAVGTRTFQVGSQCCCDAIFAKTLA